MSIRWKITLLCIALSIVPLFFFQRYTVRVFDGFTRKMREEQMIDYAHVIGDDFRRQFETGTADPGFESRLRDYEKRFGARLRIVDTAGIVIHDSSDAPETGLDVSHHRDMQKALEGRYGARTSLTPDRQLLFYHIALPVQDSEGKLIAVAAVQAHTRDITRAIQVITRDYRIAMAIVAALAILAAIILSWTLTYRLRNLTSAIQSFARGRTRFSFNTRGRDEIARLSMAVKQTAGEINTISTRQSQMFDSTVHQLKTPLTAIRGAVDIIRDDPDTQDTRERFLRNIQISADRLLSMINRLGELSRLKTEELRGSKESVDFPAFLSDVVQRNYPSPATPIVLEPHAPAVELVINPERIEQVIANLLDNALRHTPPEGKITIRTHTEDGFLVTSVADTGSGIEATDLDCIFEQFFTTVPHDQTATGGTGLGLSIARSIIENHGGTIHAASKGPNQGSQFTFTLPL